MPAECVFICYRRDDSGETAGRIFDRLAKDLPERSVFRDLDSIPLGVDFREHVRRKLADARAVLVLIGPDWLKIRDEQRQRRLENEADHVRVEVELSLGTPGLRVIPILCRHAGMPRARELPATMEKLAFLNGHAVRPDPDFHHDVDRLLKQLRQILAEPPPKKEQPAPAPQPPVVGSEKAAGPAAKPSAASTAPTETKPAPLPEKTDPQMKDAPPKPRRTPGEIAKSVLMVVFVLAFYAGLLWGGFHVVRLAFGVAGDGIAWVKKKFANPTPAPLEPKPWLQRTTPWPSLSDPARKSTLDILKDTGTPTPTPLQPRLTTPAPSLIERLKQATKPTPTPSPDSLEKTLRDIKPFLPPTPAPK